MKGMLRGGIEALEGSGAGSFRVSVVIITGLGGSCLGARTVRTGTRRSIMEDYSALIAHLAKERFEESSAAALYLELEDLRPEAPLAEDIVVPTYELDAEVPF